MSKVVGVSFNDSKKIYYFLVNEIDVFKGDNVIVDTDGGEQFARVVTNIIDVDEKKLNNPLKNVIRIANLDDVNINENNIKDAEKALKAFTETVAETLQNGDKIQLVGFGTFEVAERAARTGKNPQTGKEIKIPASKAPKFKAGKALKDTVNK